MNEERLSGALQENILTVLCFNDQFCKIIRHSLTPSLFESAVYRDIAGHAMDFIDQFGEAIKEHLPDSLENIIKGSDSRKAASYSRTVENLYLSRESVNAEYVVSQLNQFIRLQNIKSSIIKAVELVEQGDINQAEVELEKGLNSQIVTFDPGTFFADPKQSLRFFDEVDDGIHTGIEELDKREIFPRPGELFTFIAPPKKGKSWALIHIGKWGLLQRKKVLHITLEMSEERTTQRYIQSFFSVSKRNSKVKITSFKKDDLGRLIDFEDDEVERPTLRDEGIRSSLASRLVKEFKKRPPLIIKRFPTGSLTMAGLKAYLDSLDRFHKFHPDMLVLDYPDLMQLSSDNLRLDTGKLYKDLRGLAVERNFALAVASQGNRSSSKAKVISDDMVAEDYSKIATSDNVVTYNQTPQEKTLGLARLFVSNGRNDEDKFTVLISQNYDIGQFCLDSVYLTSDSTDLIERKSSRRKVEEED